MIKFSKKLIFLVLIIVLGGLGGVIADRYLFPYLSTKKFFSRYEFLKKSLENVTVINRTEQVMVKEDATVGKVAGNVLSSVVNIAAYPDPAKNTGRKTPATVQNFTGLIITGDGLIATYAPGFISDGLFFQITTADKNTFTGQFAGLDNYSNLAFFKIESGNFSAAAFGNSNEAMVGEKIIAVGNAPGDLSVSYAAGILKSKSRSYNLAGKTVSASEKMEGVFQDDLNLSREFAGGPVIDYSGNIIGIVGRTYSDNQTDYFIMPSNKIKNVIDRAIRNELDKNPVLGIYYLPINKTLTLANNLPSEKGAWIYSSSGQAGLAIIAGSSAQKSGLLLNDIIVQINNQEINPENSLSDLLYKYNKGDEIELNVLRAGNEIKIKVQL